MSLKDKEASYEKDYSIFRPSNQFHWQQKKVLNVVFQNRAQSNSILSVVKLESLRAGILVSYSISENRNLRRGIRS